MKPRPLVIAHRGNSKFAPENTLAAFRGAADLGADGVEMDLRLTRDGRLVLMHDQTVERTTNGTGCVAELCAEDVARLDAGAWKGPEFAGEPVPSFENAAHALRGEITLYAEVKTGSPGAEIARVVSETGIAGQLVLLSWGKHPETTANLMEHLPGVPVLELGKAPERAGQGFFEAKVAAGLRGLDYSFETLTPDFVRAAQEAGLQMFAWTVNEPDELRAAIDMGLDGITTDDPALLLEILSGRPS